MSVCLDGGEAATIMTSVYLCARGWLDIAHSSHPPHLLATVDTSGLGFTDEIQGIGKFYTIMVRMYLKGRSILKLNLKSILMPLTFFF